LEFEMSIEKKIATKGFNASGAKRGQTNSTRAVRRASKRSARAKGKALA
jgi:hypothetical protein